LNADFLLGKDIAKHKLPERVEAWTPFPSPMGDIKNLAEFRVFN
jgi:hypothetical protein